MQSRLEDDLHSLTKESVQSLSVGTTKGKPNERRVVKFWTDSSNIVSEEETAAHRADSHKRAVAMHQRTLQERAKQEGGLFQNLIQEVGYGLQDPSMPPTERILREMSEYGLWRKQEVKGFLVAIASMDGFALDERLAWVDAVTKENGWGSARDMRNISILIDDNGDMHEVPCRVSGVHPLRRTVMTVFKTTCPQSYKKHHHTDHYTRDPKTTTKIFFQPNFDGKWDGEEMLEMDLASENLSMTMSQLGISDGGRVLVACSGGQR